MQSITKTTVDSFNKTLHEFKLFLFYQYKISAKNYIYHTKVIKFIWITKLKLSYFFRALYCYENI